MNETCTVLRNGNSAAVVLPSEWRKQFGIKAGDTLRISTPAEGEITFSVIKRNNKKESLGGLLDILDGLPNVAWERGDSKEDDRELLGQRYV